MIAEPATPSAVIAERSFLVDRPVAILMVFLATVVFGTFSFLRLPVSLMPELSYPTLTVRTEYAGAAPEEVENDVSRPIEEALGVIGGLRRISSISRAGVSDVVLEFSWGAEMTQAIQDTLEKLDLRGTRVTDLSPLAPLPGLRMLWIQGLSLPPDQVRSLQASQPGLELDPY